MPDETHDHFLFCEARVCVFDSFRHTSLGCHHVLCSQNRPVPFCEFQAFCASFLHVRSLPLDNPLVGCAYKLKHVKTCLCVCQQYSEKEDKYEEEIKVLTDKLKEVRSSEILFIICVIKICVEFLMGMYIVCMFLIDF